MIAYTSDYSTLRFLFDGGVCGEGFYTAGYGKGSFFQRCGWRLSAGFYIDKEMGGRLLNVMRCQGREGTSDYEEAVR
jgi:hypothetical protein